jgi:hypothetical protein
LLLLLSGNEATAVLGDWFCVGMRDVRIWQHMCVICRPFKLPQLAKLPLLPAQGLAEPDPADTYVLLALAEGPLTADSLLDIGCVAVGAGSTHPIRFSAGLGAASALTSVFHAVVMGSLAASNCLASLACNSIQAMEIGTSIKVGMYGVFWCICFSCFLVHMPEYYL